MAHQPAGPCAPLHPGRWVYEKRADSSAGAKRVPKPVVQITTATAWASGRNAVALLSTHGAASPFPAKRIQTSCAGSDFLLICQPARAQRSMVTGGYVGSSSTRLRGGCPGHPGHLSAAAFAGSLSPISYIAALAWCPTVCRGTDDCGEHHPSTVAPWRIRPGARHLGRLRSGARENPICAEGWAMWVIGGSPDLFKATGGTYRLGKPSG